MAESAAQQRVLVVMAHPDDAEISSGATMAKWASEGREVHLLVLTNGDRGSDDRDADRAEVAATRREETAAAAERLGLASHEVLDTHDGELDNTRGQQERVARAIRRIRPDIVIAPDPTAWFFDNTYYNHSDHRNAGAIALDAVFPGAGNPHFFRNLLDDEGLEPWNVPQVWLTWTQEPSHREDVSGWMEAKVEALGRHASQVQGGMLGFFEEWLVEEAAREGESIGAQHAESFRVLKLND
jgi:LmbE family N-acetylglucosaminyl deacetylase